MSTEDLQAKEKTKQEKYLAIKELLKGFTITEASEIVDYFVRQIRMETKIP